MDSTYSNAVADERTKARQSPDHDDDKTIRPRHPSTSTATTSAALDDIPMRLYQPSYVTDSNSYTHHDLPSIHRSTSTRSKEQSPVQAAALAASQQPSGVIMGPAGLPLASTTKDMITGTTPTQRPSRAKKGKRVHDCTHPGCGKIFTRAEHLRRHQLNHSTEVVYKCEICDKKFVRQDLLSRHQERQCVLVLPSVELGSDFGYSATSTMKAVPQAYRGHQHQYGPMGYAMTAPGDHILPLPSSEYGPHSYDPSGFRGVLPQNVDTTTPFPHPHYSNASSPHPSSVISSPAASVSSLQATYPPSHPGEPHLDFSNIARTPSPARRGYSNIPYHLPPKDARRHDPYILSQSEIQRGIPASVSVASSYQTVQQIQPSSMETYGWLLDEQQPGKGLGIQMDHLAPMQERSRVASSYSPPPAHPDCTPSNPTMENRGFFQFQHPIDEKARANVLGIVNNPTFGSRDVGSMPAMQGYLASYWKNFHNSYPVLHRPTFVPSEQLSCLIAMVVAVGASYSDDHAARNLALTIYERVRDYVLTGEFQSLLASNLQFQQTLLLVDIFGKLRTNQQTFTSDMRIDSILADVVHTPHRSEHAPPQVYSPWFSRDGITA
ncbi:hypothetical protein BJ508DRAFT_129738 [Ascobolus immersus RN42]|uniref:C2H2-type domain-containing protein n=1 Tax=Ascobolus immersus RN42 TaxID=1160509 RepID=A0A3N4I4Y5_ASCIM|nr:hypothetical protein BJ508DRAFT_129738 [Ascobolus immersus RN42]